MSEHIDHAAEALRCLQLPALEEVAAEANALAYTQVHATLALAHQQRIANLIGLFSDGISDSILTAEEQVEIQDKIKEGLGL